MKAIFIGLIALLSGVVPVVSAQSMFSSEEYASFLRANRDLPSGTLLSRHAPAEPYYKSSAPVLTENAAWLDSVEMKYELTDGERSLLLRNGFVVSERLNFPLMGQAFHDIYSKDLPVFLSTDAVLHAMHDSYDRILRDLEIEILKPNLAHFLDALASAYPALVDRYESNPAMLDALADVDLYVTIARSLMAGSPFAPQYADTETVGAVWAAIQAEQMTGMPLFCEHSRQLDFSQFTVRGHYANPEVVEVLGPYFKCMMWLGRTDFLLTEPPAFGQVSWSREDLRRMSMDAVLLHELMDISGERGLLEANDRIITFMVGESDNLTPAELAGVIQTQHITGADVLLEESKFDAFQAALRTTPEAGQRILSDFFIMDPFAETPDPLPVSFRLMGQKFILDSYVFSNVVYDRILYNGQKVWRPMPDPLDAMFVLGNDDALPLLESQLDQYHYSSQLSGLRYLTDAYDEEFWGVSLYNTWLAAIRELNPSPDQSKYPYFMRTAAWRQEKLNTQLASWSQLRHDNLLYAKQSYTGGTACSYPHSFIEPYPEFYRRVASFAESAGTYFAALPGDSWRLYLIKKYFPRLRDTMLKLEALAQKELAREPFSAEDRDFLGRMLFIETGSGAPPFSGWYADLFYEQTDPPRPDYVIADVHTQPTDEFGNVVGRVLHVGTGRVNLGVFLTDSPSNEYAPMAYVGPVMSYYETITSNFDRLTDERWIDMVGQANVPARPDWVNLYLADSKGNTRAAGRELPGVAPTGVSDTKEDTPQPLRLLTVHPNPFNPETSITYTVPADGTVSLAIYDVLGRKVADLAGGYHAAGKYTVRWNARNAGSGVYFCRIRAAGREEAVKMLLMR